jgi:hypothetical protein
MIRENILLRPIFLTLGGHSYAQKQAHPSTAKKGNMDPEAVFPLDHNRRGKIVTYD